MTFVAGQVLTAAQLNALDITSLTVDTDTLVVDATNDRVGINTASPSVALDVGGSVVIDDTLAVDTDTLFTNGAGQVGIGTTTPTANHVLHTHGAVLISSTTGVGNSHFPFTDGRFYYTADPETGGTGDHVFRHYSGGSYVEQMRILESGYVGIKTANPESILHLNPGTNLTPDANGVGHIMIDGSGYTSFFTMDGTGTWIGNNSGSRSMILATNETARLTVLGGGNVGVGITSPGTRLQVLSQNRAVSVLDSGTNNYAELGFTSNGSTGPAFGRLSGYALYFQTGTSRGGLATRLTISQTGVVSWAVSSGIGGPLTNTSTTSGYRYVLQNQTFGTLFDYTSVRDRKDQITNVTAEDSGRWIDALQPVTYIERWMGEGDEPDDARAWREADMQVGFIADDILANADTDHFSQVLDDGEGGLDPAGWKWECVIAAAVAEIKSLRARVATLEAA